MLRGGGKRVVWSRGLLASVALVTATPPELAVKVTGMPAIRLLVASRTSAVIVALLEPSDRMVGALVVTVMAAMVGVLPPPPGVPGVPPPKASSLPPPQAVNRPARSTDRKADLYICFT